MSFTTTLWSAIGPLRRAILSHPFLAELADGSLPMATFQHYIQQDSLYLAEFARVLALAAARAPDAEARAEFAGGARVAVDVEAALHQSFFRQFGISAATHAPAEPTPTCLAYSHYLLGVAASRSYEETIAAVLPCFWIYWEVGVALKGRALQPNPYAAWLETYADPAFGQATERVRALVDAAAGATTPAVQQAMATAFRTAARYEWMFWDSAYRQESWPVGA